MTAKTMRFLSFLLLVLHSSPFAVSSTDSISQNRHAINGKTIVSEGQVFELGFFSPSGTNAWYVGIWWKEFPDGKVVWVANRENPLMDSSGVLMIGADGNLVIIDGEKNIIWSTKVADLKTNQTIATLSDTGNLVLKEDKENGLVLWESFNRPSDTFLAGMKVGLNEKTGERITIASWKDDKNPSPGRYVSQVDPQDLTEIVITNGSVKHYRTGQWNGMHFIGHRKMSKDYLTGFKLLADSQAGSHYFTSTLFNISSPSFLYLSSSGFFINMKLDVEKKQWIKIGEMPESPCTLFNRCGLFGQCKFAKSLICSCLIGYEPKSTYEWNNGNWKDGCVRREKFKCETSTSSAEGEGDRFLKLTGLRLPEYAQYVYVPDRTGCEGLCLRNCSCLAYAYVDGIGCMIWEKNLVDIEKFNYGGEDLYVRLAHSELGGKKVLARSYVVIPIISSATLCLGLITFFFYRWRTKITGWVKEFRSNIHSNKSSRILQVESPVRQLSVNGIKRGGSPELPSFSFQHVEAATNKFSSSSKLGEGGFGPVYKGKLSDGKEIAVKRLSRSSVQGLEEFKNEVMLISKLQHRNLVRLLGYSVHKEEKLLVYEYMPNKSLDFFIFGSGSGSKEKATLTWGQRCDIVEGIARGILYLHHDSRLKIIHRDLKASNILLDEEMTPRISDFGMARIFCGNQTTANTNRVVGTYGYMSPEYAMQGIFSEKSDVFSFGVLVLEILSSKRNTSIHHFGDAMNLLGHAWQLWKEDKALEMVDPRLVNSCNATHVIRCINVSLLCVQETAGDRPTMGTVVFMLCNDVVLPSPKRPAFCHMQDRSPDQNMPLPEIFTCSATGISETTIYGR